jgi:hypothetical protein
VRRLRLVVDHVPSPGKLLENGSKCGNGDPNIGEAKTFTLDLEPGNYVLNERRRRSDRLRSRHRTAQRSAQAGPGGPLQTVHPTLGIEWPAEYAHAKRPPTASSRRMKECAP